MWKYVLLLGGFLGVLTAMLMTWGYPDDIAGLNLLIYSDTGIYRYNVPTDTLFRLRKRTLTRPLDYPDFLSMTASPDGQWFAIMRPGTRHPTLVFSTASGQVLHEIENDLFNSPNGFDIWAPDSRHVAWLGYKDAQSLFYLQVLDILAGLSQEMMLTPDFLLEGRWRNDHRIEAWVEDGTLMVDVTSGQWTKDPEFIHMRDNDYCNYVYVSSEGISLYDFISETNILKADALEVEATEDLQMFAYLEAAGHEAAHLFIYDLENDKRTQISSVPLNVGRECIADYDKCLTLHSWSPDERWILLNIEQQYQLLDVDTGQIRPIFDNNVIRAVWTVISFKYNRQHFALWMLASALFLATGLWQMVV